MHLLNRYGVAVLGLLLMLFSYGVAAQTSSTGWLQMPEHPPVQVRLSLTGEQQGEQIQALLEVQLDDDWKTYWRSPGAGGIPPTLSWQEQSHGINEVSWQWPFPQQFEVSGLTTIGYAEAVHFPLTLEVNQPQGVLAGVLTMSSCTNVCVLTDFPIRLAYDTNQLHPDASTIAKYESALDKVPTMQSESDDTRATWSATSAQLAVEITRDSDWLTPTLYLHSEQPELEDVEFKLNELRLDGAKLIAVYAVSHWLELPDLTATDWVVSVRDENLLQAYAVTARAGSIASQAATQVASPSLLWILALALVGGLILNIMPCVLPVLGLKLQSVMSSGGVSQQRIRRQFLATAFGVIASFWLLALGLIALRASGASIGWGIQFQNPYFILLMVIVTWLFALSLFDAVTVRLPQRLHNWSATTGSDHSYLGHFTQGALATLLATPCTAPFLGTAVAFALAASVPTILVIFTALGVGMALPWLLVALWPKTVQLLPKPGAWLAWVKPIMGLLLLATTVWLLTLLFNFVSFSAISLLVSVLLVLSLLMIGRRYGKRGVLITLGGSFLAGVATIAVLLLTLNKWAPQLPPDHHWQELNRTAIDTALAADQVVFVDVTADWCVTCKANKLGVLLQDPVYSSLAAGDIVRLRGDWTMTNEQITAYLRSNNTYGVPFNKVYGPAAPQGIALPTILTSQAVLSALAQARGEHIQLED